jgi:hypothetical protein
VIEDMSASTEEVHGALADGMQTKDTAKFPTVPEQPHIPFGQRTDGTQSAAKAVEEVAHGVKAAVNGAMVWVEKKAEALSSESGGTGPYTSQATCAPSDLDPIASGVLVAMSTQETSGMRGSMEEQSAQNERSEAEVCDKKRNN